MAIPDPQLRAHLHPPGWQNPAPAPRYNLVVIGGGTAGLVAAAGAAGLGARVALVERHLLGGDCLVAGCVPSKALISAARQRLPFAAAMQRVRGARVTIAPHDSAQRFAALGVDVFFGDGRFADRQTVAVGGQRLRFARAVIATGSRAALPPIEGLAAASPLTTDSIFELTQAPERLAIIGGGAIGCEIGQAMQRLGVQVTLFHDQPRLLDREDPEAGTIVEQALRRDGVRVLPGARVRRVETRGALHTIVHAGGADDVDAILVSAGRVANVQGLGVADAGVALDDEGRVRVDDFLRTSNPRIYACGDVCLPWKFTHAADAAARIVIQNALFAVGPLGRRRVSALNMSWCIFTDPEVAHVGSATDVDTYVERLTSLDRAVTDGATDGFVKVHTRRGNGTIAGATIVAPRAGDMIAEVAVAMAGRLSLGALAGVIHPYPTYAEAIRKCGDAYNRTRLTPRVARILDWWLRRSR
jgi:pyruvate/2-oxoglutarate dehydrogenase complex dihydrolipoamide dehydrogenase (E3) component